MNNNKGQSLVMFALIIAGVMAILISTVLLSISDLEKEVDRAKVRMNSYQATVQVAQIIQGAWDLGKRNASCAGFPGVALKTVDGIPLCMPTTIGCYAYRFCVEGSAPDYQITKVDKFNEDQVVQVEDAVVTTPLPQIEFSVWPKAFAQASAVKLKPVLSSSPSSVVDAPAAGCPASPNRTCVICGAGGNADCFHVRICTNGSTSCASPEASLGAQIAIVHSR